MTESPPTFVRGESPDGAAIVSLLLLREYAFGADGRCELVGDLEPRSEVVYYPEEPAEDKVQASLVERDSDLYAWRNHTDLVVQGTARSDKPVQQLAVTLSCSGSAFGKWTILASGDRTIDVSARGLFLSDAKPFTEMPMRYDRAYGGTDMFAEQELANPDEEALFALMFSELENRQLGAFSYPRNPAGKGYAVTREVLAGMAWPNLEWQDTPLPMDERIVLPHGRWGERPSPAGFDWYPHAWFPRIAFFGDFEPTDDDVVPQLEVELGLLPPNLRSLSLLERPKHGFAQGAHPFLCGARLGGDERLSVTAMSADGGELLLRLPNQRPRAKIVGPDGKQQRGKGVLDLVNVSCEARRVELLWRITIPVEPYATMVEDWRDRCTATIDWRS